MPHSVAVQSWRRIVETMASAPPAAGPSVLVERIQPEKALPHDPTGGSHAGDRPRAPAISIGERSSKGRLIWSLFVKGVANLAAAVASRLAELVYTAADDACSLQDGGLHTAWL